MMLARNLKNTNNIIRSVSNLYSNTTTNSSLVSMRYKASCCGGKTPSLPPVTAGEITVDDFFKIDMRIGKIIKAEHVEGAKKLVKLTIDVGVKEKKVVPTEQTTEQSTNNTSDVAASTTQTTEQIATTTESTTTTAALEQERDIRTIFSGVKQHYQPEQLQGNNVIVVCNLQPKKTKFGVSEGMVLFASDNESKNVIFTTSDSSKEVLPGYRVL